MRRPRTELLFALALSAPLSALPASATETNSVEVLSFDAAVSQALQRNPNTIVAAEEIKRARALVEQTRSASLPTLTANGSYTRLDNDRVLDKTVIAGANTIAANLTLAIPLIAPARWGQWSHARDNVDLARLSAAEVKRQLAVTVGRTYLSLIAERRVIEATERAVVNARAHASYAHQRFAGGWGTRVDEIRAAQELSTDEAQLEAQYAQLVRLQESLGVLLGSDHAVTAADDVVLPTPPPPASAIDDARNLRADVRLSRLRVDTAHHLVRDNWLDYLPSLVGSFQPFYQNPPTLTIPETGWQAQLALTIPLYDGGLRYGLAHERSALESEARATVAGTVRQAESEVRASQEELRRAATALTAARDASKQAAEALTLSNLAYQNGASTNIEVIDAERRARDAETTSAVAEDAARQAQLDLLVASGRFPQ